ncbi:cytochrome c oxidase assembly protein subunit 15 [Paenibacillus sp. UNCCL117]|uniref:COX15/CtaA family protein n=1 Tax=unclassified Paenibacillus TaxID=185978 RepID=UPI000891717B|nr:MULTISPECIES: COX15/CtaA family protein [unclassified Paenibacillus]SDE03500.1 cytochrome c oxidase assembly protein subunit 15 [Paenibacillus sp. cl123]SFW57429.1 cytochrome c oxidase assembly protein subunit 15 [Paenibacillus sp. UNCCL117]
MKAWSLASMLGMFLILVMGALVTKTESGRGCGDDWPLCNGKFIPAYTIESLIEYSHRFVVGVVGLILLVTTILVFLYSRRRDAKWYVGGAMFFTVLQAILGAMAVVWPQSSAVLALHFGFSLMSFAFTLLLYLVFTKYGDAMYNGDGTRLTRGVRFSVWAVLVYSYVVVYLGAFVRHTEAMGGCIGWPLCNGQVIPELSGPTAIAFIHRVGAAVLGLALIALFLFIRGQAGRDSGMYQSVQLSVVLVVLQILSGGFVTLSIGYDIYLLASLLHAVLISCLFGVLCYAAIASLHTAGSHGQAYGARRLR